MLIFIGGLLILFFCMFPHVLWFLLLWFGSLLVCALMMVVCKWDLDDISEYAWHTLITSIILAILCYRSIFGFA